VCYKLENLKNYRQDLRTVLSKLNPEIAQCLHVSMKQVYWTITFAEKVRKVTCGCVSLNI